jgi:hypothetical protein
MSDNAVLQVHKTFFVGRTRFAAGQIVKPDDPVVAGRESLFFDPTAPKKPATFRKGLNFAVGVPASSQPDLDALDRAGLVALAEQLEVEVPKRIGERKLRDLLVEHYASTVEHAEPTSEAEPTSSTIDPANDAGDSGPEGTGADGAQAPPDAEPPVADADQPPAEPEKKRKR